MATLVYHAGALGDFLTVLPAVKAWRYAHPDEKIVLLGKSALGFLAFNSGYIDDVWDVENSSNAWLFLTKAHIPQESRRLFRDIETAILFTASDSPIVDHLSRLGVSEIFIQNPFPLQRIPIGLFHLSLFPHYAKFLDHFGPIIHSPWAYEQVARSLINGFHDFVVIHPGSGSEIKNWPLNNFIRLSEKIVKNHYSRIVWICGEAESNLSFPAGAIIVKNAPLSVLVHVLRRSTAYFGNDSGISHLAASVGCRSIILFGPSDDSIWKPHGAHVHIVKARHFCKPCHPHGKIREGCTESCIRLLSVDDVYETFRRAVCR
jgi:heptosyltransferase III